MVLNVNEQQPSGAGLRVVLYLRQSDKEQRLSIAQQREECLKYALSRGWIVVGEYIDDGKSGSKNVEARKEWLRLIEDAQSPHRKWDAILCWDTARFGRLDSFTGAEFKQKLRKAGVWLETTRGEHIDWGTSMGRIMDAMQSENNHEYSLNISRNVIRGRRHIVDMGYWASKLPYGFDREYVEGKEQRMVVPREQIFSKPRNWRLKPIINEAEAKTIRWLFTEWRDKDMSITGTVKILNDKHILSPSGQPSWTFQQVKRVLTDRAYVGDIVMGGGERSRKVHGRIGEMVKENVFPAMIDRKMFDEVVKKIREREGAEWRPRTAAGPLSGILKCGHCGHTLARRTYRGRTKYVCESQIRRPHLGCKQWRVDEAVVLPAICKELTDSIDFAIIGALAQKKDKAETQTEVIRLRAEEAKAKRNLERAAKNILLVDPENLPAAQDALSELRKEHERIANALRLAEGSEEKKTAPDWWKQTKEVIEIVGTAWGEKYGDPVHTAPFSNARIVHEVVSTEIEIPTFRALLRRLAVEVRFFWRRKGIRNWELTTGTLRANFRLNQCAEREIAGCPTAANW